MAGYCSSCGIEIAESMNFCPSCGEAVMFGTPNQVQAYPEKREDEVNDDPRTAAISEDPFNLWLKRGRCSEKVWIWGIIPLLLPYAYYKVGYGWRGVAILIAAPIQSVLFAFLIGIPAAGFAILIYGLYETYDIAKEHNRIYAENYL